MTSPRSGAPRNVAPAVALALVTAFVLRGVVGQRLNVLPGVEHLTRGFGFYGYMAQNLLAGEGLKWEFYQGLGPKLANRAPLYPLLLAGCWRLAGGAAATVTIWCQAAVGALACLVPALVARRWAGPRAAVVAVWLAALWPYAVVNDTAMVEQVIYAPLAVLAAYALMRSRDGDSWWRTAVAGGTAGLAALARLTFGLALPLYALVLASRPRGLRLAVVFALAAGGALSPWVVRNHAVTGHYTVGTDGGRALWLSNAPGTFDHYPARSIDTTEVALLQSLPRDVRRRIHEMRNDEVGQNELFRRMAFGNIVANPGAVAWGGLRKAAALWSPVYNPGPVTPLKLGTHGVTFVLLLLGTFGAVVAVPRLRPDVPVIVATVAAFTVAAMLFWGQPRYLAPLHGLGLAAGAAWFVSRREPSP